MGKHQTKEAPATTIEWSVSTRIQIGMLGSSEVVDVLVKGQAHSEDEAQQRTLQGVGILMQARKAVNAPPVSAEQSDELADPSEKLKKR
jgi:hypothetical protein